MISNVNIEVLWILIFLAKIYIYLMAQKFNKKKFEAFVSCCRFGDKRFCKICQARKQFHSTFDFYLYTWNVIFTASTVLVCIYYTYYVLSFIAKAIPISLVYVAAFGTYDPLLRFHFPPWVDQVFMA